MMESTKQLKVLLVGCGSITQAWLKAVAGDASLQFVGLVDINLENARQVQEAWQSELNEAQIGDDLGRMIEETRPDVVFDCTVPAAHTPVTIEALKRGCHVLGEKPMADSMAKAANMLSAARESGKLYAVIQNRRYLDSIMRFRDFIQSNRIGKLTTLNADFYLAPHFGGFRDEMEHALLLDMAIHSFDQARFISAADPVSVYCHEWNPAGSWYHHGASAMAIFEMTNGIVFNYRGSWCAEGLNTSWECEWRAIGQKGSAIWDGEDGFHAQIAIGNQGFMRQTEDVDIPDTPPLTHLGHAGVIYDFLTCVRHGGTPQTTCTDNIKSLAMVHAAIQSAKTGRKVEIRY